jgi:3-phosphoshikimate 1-carboxyvinyltransferase
MQQKIRPATSLTGAIRLPGDKSISHRYAMIASVAEGESRLRNYATGADCQSTLGCLRGLGGRVATERTVEGEREGEEVVIQGVGLEGWREPVEMLDAGNSGSTIRMLSGMLAAQPFVSRIGGDESLSRRPMDRIMRPLQQMGARIEANGGHYPPLEIHGGRLRAITYELPVASAQVKTCVLLAGLFAEGETTVIEPVTTRDHTELALREFGAEVVSHRGRISVEGRPRLTGRTLYVPSDLSSAAFFLVSALLVREANLVIGGVGLNPTRAALLDFLLSMGADLRVLNLEQTGGEMIGDLLVRGGRIRGGVIEKQLTAALIDEIPVLAVLGAASEEGLEVRDASELRIKETDRIAAVAENFRRMGVEVEVTADGFRIPGKQTFRAATFDSFGDHRIAMAFAVASLRADGECTIENAEAASVSFPEFYTTLLQVAE